MTNTSISTFGSPWEPTTLMERRGTKLDLRTDAQPYMERQHADEVLNEAISLALDHDG